MNSTNVQGREIKFRAWLRDAGIMLNVFLLDQTGRAGTGKHFNTSKGYSEHGAQFVFNVDDADLLQFTGKHDKEGTELYEGDIVEFDRGEWGGDDNIHVISWDEENAEWSWGGGTTSDMCWRKKIGNIYEHPHLLKSEGLVVSEGLIDHGV